ncbi:MAG: hypothetical protein ACFFF9_09975 [Candidatus Thorarchaeota archaeon]
MFAAHPLVVEWFSVLVVIPLILTFIGLNVLKRREPSQTDGSMNINRIRLVLIGPFVTLYVLMMGIAIISLLFATDLLEFQFTIILLVFQIAASIGIGFLAGLIIAGAFEVLGVAGYILSAELLSIIPLYAIYTGQTSSWIIVGMDVIDSFLIMILIFAFCGFNPQSRIMGIKQPNEKALSIIYQRLIAEYVLETEKKLKFRIEKNSDMVAQEILHRFQTTDGILGEFIRRVLGDGIPQSLRSLEPSEIVQPSRFSLTETAFKPKGSWTLTEYQFKNRVRRFRIMYCIFLVPLLVILSFSLTDLGLQANQWTILILGGIIIFSLPIAYSDSIFTNRRMSADEGIKAILRPLEGVESKLILDDLQLDVIPSGDMVFEEQDTVHSKSKEIPEEISLKYAKFLERVAKRKDDSFLMEDTRLYGLSSRVLSTAISYLDIKEAGIEDVGDIIYPRPPGHFLLMTLAGPSAVKYMLDRLSKETSISTDPMIEKEVLERNNRLIRPSAVVLLIVTAVIVLSAQLLASPLDPFWILVIFLFALLDLAILTYAVWISWKLRNYADLVAGTFQDENRVTNILQILEKEYTSPLRFVLAREHDGLYYTGRLYTTSSGVQLKEAVFLPPLSEDEKPSF